AAEDDPVVATVNGSKIYLSEVEEARILLPPALQKSPTAEVNALLTETLIDTRLAVQRARATGLAKSEKYKKSVARIEGQLLKRLLFSTEIEKGITDIKIRARYAQLIKNVPTGNELHARHILLKDEDQAIAVIAKLNEGADFVALAKENSIGPSASTGGDLGWFGQGRMVAPFDAAAFKLKVGSHTSEPVKTNFGWHVIRVEGLRKSRIPTLAEARDEVVRQLSAEIGEQLLAELRKNASIERFEIEAAK
ncbi:MAG: peptidylprolyl isomerase, partial [Rhodospirillaceae bacterium]|nr:peptidylprolyl isomerase [Rhodospirillaceae bacterium]